MNTFFKAIAGADMDLRYTKNSTPVGSVNVALKVGYGDNERTQWAKVVLFGKRAESISEYVTKGKKLLIEPGPTYIDEWTNNEGETRHTLVIETRDIDPFFCNPRQQDASAPGGGFPDTGDDIPF